MTQKLERKRKSHEAILASAVALLRERGIKASSVSEVMAGAGLTVGGFYGHYDSKEELFVDTIRTAAQGAWGRLLGSVKGDTARERALSLVGRYLSRSHRDNVETGCLLPTVAAEVAREGEPFRGALEQEMGQFIRSLAQLLEPSSERRELAVGLIALMYGALSLSRSMRGSPLSDEFLRAAKKLAERALSDEPRALEQPAPSKH
jgi:TetR/AcrR family transcriptional regulator, transcriptional repressor for nem operon